LPIKLTHNVDCFGYLISNKVENKKLFFATDTTSLPNIADSEFDCMLIECNYNFDKVIDNGQKGLLTNDGYKNHMALEELVDWLRFRENKPKNLVAIHLSNNGNIDEELVEKELSRFTQKFYIAKKGVTIQV
jgi:ribonuclease BN (tRNA processing enzyme)